MSLARGAVYPRVDGAASLNLSQTLPYIGLSPRGRGSRGHSRRPARRSRSIPAWTGQPAVVSGRTHAPLAYQVYPRVDRAARFNSILRSNASGLSPRGRGSRGNGALCSGRDGSIPAWTGQPLNRTDKPNRAQVYPRVDGAAVLTFPLDMTAQGLSPRGRGSPIHDVRL